MLRFYRVEDSEGYGMYHSDPADDVVLHMQDTKGRHPQWYHDPKLKKLLGEEDPRSDFRFRFAFSSLEQLKFWVYKKEWREGLHDSGLFVSVFDAEGYHGDTQAVYLWRTRVDVERLSILEV